jgi:integrase
MRPAKKSVQIMEGKVNLYQRYSGTWYCKFVIKKSSIRKTTKTSNFEEAKQVAFDLYMTACIKDREGIPVINRTFKSLADAVMKEYQKDSTANYPYILFLTKYALPFFGNKSILSIDSAILNEFDEYRTKIMGSVPSKATIAIHNLVMNAVFNLAEDKKILASKDIPKFSNNGTESERRPDFTVAEYRVLTKYMYHKWINEKGINPKEKDKRLMIRDYVLFLAATGCRPGTETKDLKFKHIRTFMDKGVEYIAVNVNGKTGRRELVARHSAWRPLERLVQHRNALAGMTLRDVLEISTKVSELNSKGLEKEAKELEMKSEELVIAMPSGKTYSRTMYDFGEMLTRCNLRIDPRTGDERVLYSLRHMYITRALVNAVDPYFIASNCGTSLKMIEKNYSHFLNTMRGDKLAGRPRLNKKIAQVQNQPSNSSQAKK